MVKISQFNGQDISFGICSYLSTKILFSGYFHAKSGILRYKVGQSPFSDVVRKKYNFYTDMIFLELWAYYNFHCNNSTMRLLEAAVRLCLCIISIVYM